MKRKRFLIVLTAMLLTAALLLSGCQNKNRPSPETETIESADNRFGARYSFTPEEFTGMAKSAFDDEDFGLTEKGWKLINGNMVDDNGVKYSAYRQNADDVIFTVAVENDSKKVINIGCGCQSSQLEDKEFRDRFIGLCAKMAQVAGGYKKEDTAFFSVVFSILLGQKDDTFCYKETLYIKSVDDAAVVMMVAPCSEAYIEDNHYQEMFDTIP